MKSSTLLVALLTSSLVVACGGSGSDNGGSSGTSGTPESSGNPGTTERTGTTNCGVQTCQAGAYCLNLACVPGCLSNTNCASAESCEKSGGNTVGTCNRTNVESPDAAPVAPDCTTFCSKLEACDPQGWSTVTAQCSQAKGRTCACIDVCGAKKSSCISCVNAAATCGDANNSCGMACK